VRQVFQGTTSSHARAALALIADRRRLSLGRASRAALPARGLGSQASQVGWPELVHVVTLAGSDSAGLRTFRDALHARSLTCDVAQRNEEASRALAAVRGSGASASEWLVSWLAKRVAAPVDTAPPPGCVALATQPAAVAGRAFGAFGTGSGQFDRPSDIAVGPGGIYVADQANSRVQRFAKDGTFLGAWGGRPLGDGAPADGQFITPVSVALDAMGNVYVGDFNGDRVQKFTAEGQFLLKWGTTGTSAGQFTRVAGIAVGPNGRVYVADPGNSRVQVFDQQGTFVSTFGSAGTRPGQFSTPRGITVDAAGTIYLADRNTGRVEQFAADGAFIREFGERGLNPGQFNGVYDIAIDRAGNLWIADLYNYWIQHFTPGGSLLGVVETFGAGESFNPFAIATDADGRVFVADISGGTGDRVVILEGLG
jgi:DNA-binding beta-propeller fold protein YncE